jgi:hypothetical protein
MKSLIALFVLAVALSTAPEVRGQAPFRSKNGQPACEGGVCGAGAGSVGTAYNSHAVWVGSVRPIYPIPVVPVRPVWIIRPTYAGRLFFGPVRRGWAYAPPAGNGGSDGVAK